MGVIPFKIQIQLKVNGMQLFKQNNGKIAGKTITFIYYSDIEDYMGAHIENGILNSDDWNHIIISANGFQ